MTVLKRCFDENFPANKVFASEALIRRNRDAFRGYAYHILDKRGLPLSHIALGFYLRLVEETDKEIRKDKITPREQHEESHVLTLHKLLDVVGTSWIDPDKYGSLDVLFTACILHDVIEDLKISESAIIDYLGEGIRQMHLQDILSDEEFNEKFEEISQAVEIVVLLSRKDENGKKIAQDDRIKQAKRWLENPYAYVIKMIDWNNKLQTMVGVRHFESDELAKMGKVLSETGLLFVEEQQGFTNQAIRLYPFLEKVCNPLEGIMGMQFQTLSTYKKLKSDEYRFDPKTAYPFNFNRYLEQAKPLIDALPTGNNYISPLLERLDAVSETDSKVKDFISYMLKPSFSNFEKTVPALKHN